MAKKPLTQEEIMLRTMEALERIADAQEKLLQLNLDLIEQAKQEQPQQQRRRRRE